MEEHGQEALTALLSDISARLGSAIDTLSHADGHRERALRQLRHASTQLRQARDVAERNGPAPGEAPGGDLTLLVHDLRAPLTAMLGWAQLLRSHGGDEALTLRAVETIERNGKILVGMLDDLGRTGPSRSGPEPHVQPVSPPVVPRVAGEDGVGSSRERRDRRPPLAAPATAEPGAPPGRRRLSARR